MKIKRIAIIATIALLFTTQTRMNAQGMESNLDGKQQQIVTIAAFTAKGELENLKTALGNGLDAGLTVNEVKEILIQMYAYCGFPRSLQGLNTFIALLDERKAKGIADETGKTATPITDTANRYERGKKTLEILSGKPETSPKTGYAAFAPEIERFLKEHLFADIFERDVLTYEQRELATISALTALNNVDPQLNGHKALGKNAGLSDEQINEVAEIVAGKRLGAITETPGGVKVQKVSFPNRMQITVAGNLYFPATYDENRQYAAIVVGHTFTGVKEQTAGLHAQKLAELGYIALAFDASFWGESGGTPRNIEAPEIRVEDFSAAVDFLSNHPQVDARRIGVLGICGGGGYAVSAAAIDHRIKAVATVSMYDLGRARRQGLGDIITYERRMKTLDEIGEQRTREFRGEARRDIFGVPEERSAGDTENTREFIDYYRTPRGMHPRATTAYSFTSMAPMMNFFPFAQIETISPRPLLFIVGERAVSAYFSEDAYGKAAEPKELFVVPGASHVDLYDREEYLAVTLPKLDSFFQQLNDMEQANTVFPKGEKISNTNFNGTAYLQMLMTDAETFDCTVGNVTFEPGCRNSWHAHPGGQILLITSGKGYYQERGKPKQLIKAGDIIEIPPNVVHWHGATPDSGMAHIAIGAKANAGAAVWYEPVTDEEYTNPHRQ